MGAYSDRLQLFSPAIHLPLEELETDPLVNIGTVVVTGEHRGFGVVGQQPSFMASENYAMEYALDNGYTIGQSSSDVLLGTLNFWVLVDTNTTREICSIWNNLDPDKSLDVYVTETGQNIVLEFENSGGRYTVALVNGLTSGRYNIVIDYNIATGVMTAYVNDALAVSVGLNLLVTEFNSFKINNLVLNEAGCNLLDENGNALLDENGNNLIKPDCGTECYLRDENGNFLLDQNGNYLEMQGCSNHLLDENGNRLLDENGNLLNNI